MNQFQPLHQVSINAGLSGMVVGQSNFKFLCDEALRKLGALGAAVSPLQKFSDMTMSTAEPHAMVVASEHKREHCLSFLRT